ncbi:MAG: acetoacetate decarboxylase family protein [Candidatus Riflebacteria bacterium]|nr:acetoacetate decarboxylase family protein [Candidatus Riflebacteria bacterium]
MRQEFPLFRGLRFEEVALPSGARHRLPLRYHDWSAMTATFPAPAAALAGLVRDPGLAPLELLPGRGLITFAAMDYREMDGLPPYAEFAVLVPVRERAAARGFSLLPSLFPEIGVWVDWLPVTTPAAEEFGRAVWGYPKEQAAITFEDRGDWRVCRVVQDGRLVVALRVRRLPLAPRAQDYHTYTQLDGRRVKALVQTRGDTGVSRFARDAAFRLGPHPRGRALAALRIKPAPVESVFAPHIHSLLFPGNREAAGFRGGEGAGA